MISKAKIRLQYYVTIKSNLSPTILNQQFLQFTTKIFLTLRLYTGLFICRYDVVRI